jgi:nucleoid-associated protein YgaU
VAGTSAPETPTSPPAVATAPATEPPPADAPAASDAPPPAAEPETDIAAAPAEDGALPAPPPAGVDEVLAPKLQSAGGAVIIRRGDSLWRISRRVYGRGVRYSTIYLANQSQIEDPDKIWPGQVFKVPEKSADGEVDADYSTLGDSLTTAPAEGVQ